MNSKYRSVEDTVVSKNVLSEIGVPEISNKYLVVRGTINLTGLTAGTVTPILREDGQLLNLPRGAFIETLIIRNNGSVGITGTGSINVGYSLVSNNGSLLDSSGNVGLNNFNSAISGVGEGQINSGDGYTPYLMVLNNANTYVLSLIKTGSLSGVVQITTHMYLP